MTVLETLRELPAWLVVFLAVVVALALLALVNALVAFLAERRHPPTGSFIEVDGVRLHYSDRGAGRPVVLIHGNAVTGGDYDTSGVAERLAATCRVIVFDRPGFGYSERPRARLWTAAAQADLLHGALAQLGVRRPVLVGHSWGTLVALAYATRHPADAAGLVLLSGYYFPTPRLDALMVAPVVVPVLGDILRYTLSPLLGWLTMPAMKRAMFAPSPVTPRFAAEYSTAMEMRPSQIRATAADGTLMIPSAMGLSPHYRDLAMPVAIMAGSGDLVVGHSQAEQLQKIIPGSTVQVAEGVGHMIHHVRTEEVVGVIEAVIERSAGEPAPGRAESGVKLGTGDMPDAA